MVLALKFILSRGLHKAKQAGLESTGLHLSAQVTAEMKR